jgi:4-hydroxybenzoate polyprenyltransferase
MKNGLVFAALLFSGQLTDPRAAALATLAFVAFCLASSAIYALNDTLDAREDRLHPRKRLRPVAAGLISPAQAIGLAVLLGAVATGVGFGVHVELGLVILLYLGVNLLYCVTLKHTVLLDVMAIAAGFVLRAIGGAVAIQVLISLWFLVCVPLLSLLLAVAKRRHELITVEEATGHRAVLNDYPPQLLDQLIAVLSAGVIITYLLYAMDSAKPYQFMLTSPFIMYGVFRYLYLVYHRVEGGSPDELLLSDVPLLVTAACWVLATAAVIYLV